MTALSRQSDGVAFGELLNDLAKGYPKTDQATRPDWSKLHSKNKDSLPFGSSFINSNSPKELDNIAEFTTKSIIKDWTNKIELGLKSVSEGLERSKSKIDKEIWKNEQIWLVEILTLAIGAGISLTSPSKISVSLTDDLSIRFSSTYPNKINMIFEIFLEEEDSSTIHSHKDWFDVNFNIFKGGKLVHHSYGMIIQQFVEMFKKIADTTK